MEKVKQHRGFTLIELMIAVAIVSILASIALPAYTNYIKKARRADVQQYMLNLAQLNQRFFLDNRAYTDTLATLQSPPVSISTYYTVAINTSAGPPATFSIVATPTSAQLGEACGTLTVTNTGSKTSSTGTNCW